MNIEHLFAKMKIYKIKNGENVYKIPQTAMEHMNTYTLKKKHNLKSCSNFGPNIVLIIITPEKSTITFSSHHALCFISITAGTGLYILIHTP
jgi:hypothetical protein